MLVVLAHSSGAENDFAAVTAGITNTAHARPVLVSCHVRIRWIHELKAGSDAVIAIATQPNQVVAVVVGVVWHQKVDGIRRTPDQLQAKRLRLGLGRG